MRMSIYVGLNLDIMSVERDELRRKNAELEERIAIIDTDYSKKLRELHHERECKVCRQSKSLYIRYFCCDSGCRMWRII